MTNHRAAAWLLLVLVLPVWAVGFLRSLDMRRSQIKPRGSHGWLKRYSAVQPHLEGSPKVTIVYDPYLKRSGNKHLFRAQYALAPTVVNLPHRRLPPVQPRKMPLIYDCYDKTNLERTLEGVGSQARQLGVAMRTERVARGLAVVWLTEK